MRYTDAVNYIEGIPGFAGKTDLSNTRELLRRMGDSQEHMRVVHVAGTNGKGSVCAFLSEILGRCGKRVGMFTSPHLEEMTERIRICGQDVDREEFVRAFERMRQITEEMCADGFSHPAYFEWLFGMGMLIFAWHRVDVLVLEAGLGGLRDCTNVIAHPKACVITSVSHDHMKYLGNTLAEIAAHKAGIVKEAVPVIYDARCVQTGRVIRERAEAMHAPCIPFCDDMVRICAKSDKRIDFILNYSYDKTMSLSVPFPAMYQVCNASLAVLTAKVLAEQEGSIFPDEEIRLAVSETSWPGRMEQVRPDIFLDGAHNEEGIRQFLAARKDICGDRPASLLFSAMADKAYSGMIRLLCEQGDFRQITVTQVDTARAVPARVLAQEFRKHTGARVNIAGDPEKAFTDAAGGKGDGILFCAGSLYLIGEIKRIMRRQLC